MSSTTTAELLPHFSPQSAGDAAHAPLTEHEYSSTHGKGARTVTLKLLTRSKSPSHLPVVLEGDSLAGTVVLNLREASSAIKSVSLEVTGTLSFSHFSNVRLPFLDIRKELWSSTNAHSDGPNQYTKGATGEFSWPFSIDLPKTVHLKHGETEDYPLPPTFGTRRGSAVINYQVVAIVTHGILSAEHPVATDFIFVPAIRPGPPSEARQISYEEKQPLLGPEADPKGWKTLEPVSVKGTSPDGKEITADFTLSLASPLEYTRGSSIPLWLVIRSSDAATLDLLSAPKAPIVRLRRTVIVNYAASVTAQLQTIDLTKSEPPAMDSIQSRMYPPAHDFIQRATWWPVPSIEEGTRILQGEIHLRHALQPTCHFGNFENFYKVMMFTPSAPGFSYSGKDDSMVEEQVEIATVYAEGPRPITYSHVEYDELLGEDGGGKAFSENPTMPWY